MGRRAIPPSSFVVDRGGACVPAATADGHRPTAMCQRCGGRRATTEGGTMATATDLSPIETANALQALVREHADEAEAQGYVAEPVVRTLARAGLYRLCAPAVFGGVEADPITTIKVIEAISAGDGATGWALMIGIETVGIGGSLMALETAATLFAEHPDLVMCGALNPQGRARRVEGGWIVNGRWPFAVGVPLRTLLLGSVHRRRLVAHDVRRGPRAPHRLRGPRHVARQRAARLGQPRRGRARPVRVGGHDDRHPGPSSAARGHVVPAAAVLPPRLQQGRREPRDRGRHSTSSPPSPKARCPAS